MNVPSSVVPDVIDAVGAVVLRGGGPWLVLLIRRAKPPGLGTWTLPGGHVEPGEDGETAVAREVAEETGLAVRAVAFLETFELHAAGRTYAIREYLCAPIDASEANEPVALRPGDDAAEAIWAPEEDLAARGVSAEARAVIAHAVAVTRDRKRVP
jgi:ADP-ribose pyrophosphatase YjhB (NUDIX family)